MRKVLLLAFAIFALLGCSKDDDKNVQTITNLSGVTWYDAELFFKDVQGGDLTGSSQVGTVAEGESCRVSSDNKYFHLYAKDRNGTLVMSKDVALSSSVTVSAQDLLYVP